MFGLLDKVYTKRTVLYRNEEFSLTVTAARIDKSTIAKCSQKEQSLISNLNERIIIKEKIRGRYDLRWNYVKSSLTKEYNCLKLLNYCNNTINVFDFESNETRVRYCMECMDCDLFDHFLKYGFTRNELTFICHCILNGINEAHINGIIIGDLKPENIMVEYYKNSKDNNARPIIKNVKLIDFGGCVKLVKGSKYAATKDLMMTPNYNAPEALRGTSVSKYKYVTTAVDIWAFGGCLFFWIFNIQPFESKNATNEDIFANISNHRIGVSNWQSRNKDKLLQPLFDIMVSCLNYDPDKRPNAKQLLSNYAFDNIDKIVKAMKPLTDNGESGERGEIENNEKVKQVTNENGFKEMQTDNRLNRADTQNTQNTQNQNTSSNDRSKNDKIESKGCKSGEMINESEQNEAIEKEKKKEGKLLKFNELSKELMVRVKNNVSARESTRMINDENNSLMYLLNVNKIEKYIEKTITNALTDVNISKEDLMQLTNDIYQILQKNFNKHFMSVDYFYDNWGLWNRNVENSANYKINETPSASLYELAAYMKRLPKEYKNHFYNMTAKSNKKLLSIGNADKFLLQVIQLYLKIVSDHKKVELKFDKEAVKSRLTPCIIAIQYEMEKSGSNQLTLLQFTQNYADWLAAVL